MPGGWAETVATSGASIQRPPPPAGPYLVAGLGRAGRAAIELLRAAEGPTTVEAWDAALDRGMTRIARELRRSGIGCTLGGDGTDALGTDVRCLVKSPGIPLDHPLVRAAEQRGVAVVDELELAWRASPLPMVGITGTKGKSTITKLVAALGEAASGAGHMAGNTDFAPALSAVDATSGILACEISSQQLEGCTDLLPEIAIFTNVHGESNRHGSVDATAAIKRTLFVRGDRCVPTAIVNADDAHGAEIGTAVAERGGRVVRYGRSEGADYRVLAADWSLREASVELATPRGPVTVASRLPGLQNSVNVSAALAAGAELGLSVQSAAATIATVAPPPGRCEAVDRGQSFDVLVDMAHTPTSIREILTTLRKVVDSRNGASLRTVLGAPGGFTMPAPREQSGRLARQLSDQLVVTGASLRGEPPLMNLAAILRGARSADGGEVFPVLDRGAGVRLAIESATAGDVVVAIGRGPLRGLTFDRHGGGMLASDAELAAEALQAIGAKSA
jgi:UDP-N-acetylmuramoylalanine-D-glutamate ligase